jgi:hypothetical protein
MTLSDRLVRFDRWWLDKPVRADADTNWVMLKVGGIPADRHHQRRHRRHQPDHQTGETRRLRLPQQDPLPPPGTVAQHPTRPSNASENTTAVRPKLKSQ